MLIPTLKKFTTHKIIHNISRPRVKLNHEELLIKEALRKRGIDTLSTYNPRQVVNNRVLRTLSISNMIIKIL